jgi:ribA/ribD-fused uncharacterized protein
MTENINVIPPKTLFIQDALFFWDGPLSQWSRTKFSDTTGNVFSSCEQYMMYHKALLFGDAHTAEQILNVATTPREQKRLGRSVTGFNEDTWNKHKIGIVWQGNYLRFTQDEAAGRFLSSTKDNLLVEASPYDCVWGIGLGPDDPNLYDKMKWRGDNLLGEVLMSLRSMLKHI